MKKKLFLTFDRSALDTPIMSSLASECGVVFNIFGATVNEDVQFLAIEVEGSDDSVQAAMDFLRESGVRIEECEA